MFSKIREPLQSCASGFEEIALLQKVRHECVAQLVDFVWASKEKGTLFRC